MSFNLIEHLSLFDEENIPAEILRPAQLTKTRGGFYRVGTTKVKTCQCKYLEYLSGRTCEKCFRYIPTPDDVIKTLLLNK